jgi:hypothetical protein
VLTVYSNGWASFVQHAIFWRKPPNKRLQAERLIRATGQEIDALVYELHGLTEEEIAIVEGQGQPRRGGSETRPYEGIVVTEASPFRHTTHTTEMLRFAQQSESADLRAAPTGRPGGRP